MHRTKTLGDFRYFLVALVEWQHFRCLHRAAEWMNPMIGIGEMIWLSG